MIRWTTPILWAAISILTAACGSSKVPPSRVCERMLACDTDNEMTMAECEQMLADYTKVLRPGPWNAMANCWIGMSCEEFEAEDSYQVCMQAAIDAAPANAGDALLKAYCKRGIDCGQFGGTVSDCLSMLKDQAGDYLGSMGMLNDATLACLADCTAGLDCDQLYDFFEICAFECELPWAQLDLDCDHGYQEDEACVCDQGWAGELCDTCAEGYVREGWDCVAYCQEDSCSGHGLCSDEYGYVYCSCDVGYTGERCEACAEGYLEVDSRCRPTAGCDTDGQPCDDGLVCTTGDTCGQGVCIGAAVDCDDGLDCTTDGCMEIAGGCTHEPVPTGGPEGYLGDAACDNGLDDDCDGATDQDDADCLTTPCASDGDCPDDQNPCTVARCDGGLCTWPPVPEASPCAGANACTATFLCRSGSCEPGPSDLDADGDGFIDAACPFGFDCDDNDAGINPAAEGPRGSPSCSDGLDNDCDGLTDAYDASCWELNCNPEGWCLERPRTGAHDLAAVWAAAPDDVWATGGYESILHWDGTGWVDLPSPTYYGIYAMCGCAPDDGWAVTQIADVMRYDGVSWEQFPVPNGPHILYDLDCRCENTPTDDVWAAGRPGELLHYDGVEWTELVIPDIADLYGVWSPGPGEAWAVGRSGAMLHYATGAGEVVDTGLTETLNGIWGRDPNDIWAVGNSGTILHYDGQQWTDQSIEYGGEFSAVWGLADGPGPWVVRGGWRDGAVYEFDGAGWHSSAIFGDDPPALNALHGTSAGDLWAVGDRGAIVHWDGQQAIELVGHSPTTRAACAQPMDDGRTRIFVAGDAENGMLEWNGADWQVTTRPLGRSQVDIQCAGVHGVWTMSDDGEFFRFGDSLYETSATEDLPITQYIEAFSGRVIDDRLEVWAVGDNGLTAHLQDGAWTLGRITIASEVLVDVWFSPTPADPDAVAVGANGGVAILSGGTWTATEPLTVEDLTAVWGDGQGGIWVVGGNGTVLRWTGDAFAIEPVPAEGEDLYDVDGTGPSDVWVAGDGRVLHFDGSAWSSEPMQSGGYNSLVVTATDVWVIDNNGTIHHKQR